MASTIICQTDDSNKNRCIWDVKKVSEPEPEVDPIYDTDYYNIGISGGGSYFIGSLTAAPIEAPLRSDSLNVVNSCAYDYTDGGFRHRDVRGGTGSVMMYTGIIPFRFLYQYKGSSAANPNQSKRVYWYFWQGVPTIYIPINQYNEDGKYDTLVSQPTVSTNGMPGTPIQRVNDSTILSGPPGNTDWTNYRISSGDNTCWRVDAPNGITSGEQEWVHNMAEAERTYYSCISFEYEKAGSFQIHYCFPGNIQSTHLNDIYEWVGGSCPFQYNKVLSGTPYV